MADSEGRGTGPIALAIFGSTVVIAGALLINECSKRSDAAREADTARIMRALDTDPVQAGKNLNFLVKAELIGNKDRRDKIAALLGQTRYGTGPGLGAANPDSICPLPVDARVGLPEGWLTINCGYWWPRNDGFEADPSSGTIDPAKVKFVDRYGAPSGTFVSPADPESATYGARALPYDKNKMPFHRYEVLKPIPVKAGKAAWWFGEPGGAVQYKTEKTVQQLIDDGSLKEVPAGPPK